MQRLRAEHGSSILLITHDMGVVSEIADRVLVMYGGRAAEVGSRTEVFHHPQHPYTWGLLGSVPRTDRPRTRRLAAIPGAPISPLDAPSGCRFAPRCRFAHAACAQQPPLVVRGPDHADACWLEPSARAELRIQADAAAEEART
jgi:peptide/nickel transport system ATP-binding protein